MTTLDFSPMSRLIFGFITLAAVMAFVQVMAHRVDTILSGRREDRSGQPFRRLLVTLRYALGQYRMPQEWTAGLFHIFIFAGFLVVSLRTLTLFGMGLSGSAGYQLPFLGETTLPGQAYAILKDMVSGLVMVGCIGFAWRRLISKPVRMQKMHHAEPILILGIIFLLMTTDILLDGAQRSVAGHAGFWPAPLASIAAGMIPIQHAAGVFQWNVWLHCLMILVFLNYLPHGKHFHILTSFPNAFFSRLTPHGRLEPIRDMETVMEKAAEGEGSLGASKVEDLSWKMLLDVYTCTECGRCVPQCPAWSTDKPLSLRTMNTDLRSHLSQRFPLLSGQVKAATGPHGENHHEETLPLTGGIVSEETIWSCTLCRDCEERCPVMIEMVPRVVEMRRYLTMMESRFPQELTRVFNGLERQSNPWGISREERGKWLDKTGVKRLSDDAEVEYLFFVGCMGSYEDRAIRTSKALASILQAAKVRFGVLGEEENCNGEMARRLGNEYLAQMLIAANVETLESYKVKRIVTNCPHCYNTLKNEYPDFGGRYEVRHSAELIAELIHRKQLPKLRSGTFPDVVFHDPCFLGRYNQRFDEPRELLRQAGAHILEPKLSRRQSFCCGAGGGRMWVEEHEPRVNTARFDQLFSDGNAPSIIGVACPYCMTMLGDAAKGKGKEEVVVIKDVVEIVAEQLGLSY